MKEEFKKVSKSKGITELYAWVSMGKDGKESLMVINHNGYHLTMIDSDRNKIDSMKDIAIKLTNRECEYLKLIKFTIDEIL